MPDSGEGDSRGRRPGAPVGAPASAPGSADDSGLDRGGTAPAAGAPEAAARSLDHLRAAQLRARAVRGGLIKVAFGTIFLVGALAHALSPERHEQSSLFWITLLLLMSTVNVGLGLRSVARARRRPDRSWWPFAGAWGVLAVVLLGLLLRR